MRQSENRYRFGPLAGVGLLTARSGVRECTTREGAAVQDLDGWVAAEIRQVAEGGCR